MSCTSMLVSQLFWQLPTTLIYSSNTVFPGCIYILSRFQWIQSEDSCFQFFDAIRRQPLLSLPPIDVADTSFFFAECVDGQQFGKVSFRYCLILDGYKFTWARKLWFTCRLKRTKRCSGRHLVCLRRGVDLPNSITNLSLGCTHT